MFLGDKMKANFLPGENCFCSLCRTKDFSSIINNTTLHNNNTFIQICFYIVKNAYKILYSHTIQLKTHLNKNKILSV